MEPRFRGGKVIFARSFARIHETNAKKQGLLPLTFADPATYDLIGEDDTISVHGLAALAPDQPVRCTVHKAAGTTAEFECTHTFSPEQIEWFRAGSALNIIRSRSFEGWRPHKRCFWRRAPALRASRRGAVGPPPHGVTRVRAG